MKNENQLHILRFGTIGDKSHLENKLSSYDCLGINGNSAAYVSSSIAQLIVNNFFSNEDKGYFIDPITYSFQAEINLLQKASKDNTFPELKKSIQKLLKYYQEPVNIIKQNRTLVPEDFSSEQIKNEFCKRVLDFQYNLIYDFVNDGDMKPYLEFVCANLPQNNTIRPAFLIAPYFYLNANDIENCKCWLKLNKDFINISTDLSKNYYNNIPVYAQLVISKDILNDHDAIETIASAYKENEMQGITVWIDGFDEHKATKEELSDFIYFLKALPNIHKYNMYGSYFSELLTHTDLGLLNGVSHGLEYGEDRAVYPVGGGIPVSKYYYYPIHNRIDFTAAFKLLEKENIIDINQPDWGQSDKYFKEICNCEKCKSLIKDTMLGFFKFESNEYYEVKNRKGNVLRRKKASRNTKENCLYHYLNCKEKEFSTIRNSELSNLLSDLNNNYTKYNDSLSSPISTFNVEYLNNWKCSIEDFISER